MIDEVSRFPVAFYADRGETKKRVDGSTSTAKRVALIIGPEGGFNLCENAEIVKAATPITLGKRTLRSETAAIVASTIVLYFMGEIGKTQSAIAPEKLKMPSSKLRK